MPFLAEWVQCPQNPGLALKVPLEKNTRQDSQGRALTRTEFVTVKEIQFKLPADLAMRLEARAAALGLELGDLVELLVLRDLEGGDLSAVTEAELVREKERLRLRSGQ